MARSPRVVRLDGEVARQPIAITNAPIADGATSANQTFRWNEARGGWEIPAAVRTQRNLPNIIVLNASLPIINLGDYGDRGLR